MNKIYQKTFLQTKNSFKDTAAALKPFSEKALPIRKGFTLVELLVVVLIVGILAAVALPQYRKAVDRARFAEILLIARDLYQANMRYQLSNGTGEMALYDQLDISAPSGFVYDEASSSWKKGTLKPVKIFMPSPQNIYVYWYPSGKDMNLDIRLDAPYRGIRCAYHNDAYVKSLCASAGATEENNYFLLK